MPNNTKINFRRLSCIIFSIGVMQFFVLTFLAAFYYPGGYDYFGYFFSDLGATVARNGELNSISSELFSMALTAFAITFVPFWLVIRSAFRKPGIEKLLSTAGSALGLASSPFMIGVALLPFDIELTAHIVVAFVFILLSCCACLLYSIAVMLNRKYPSCFGLAGFFLFFITLVAFTVSLVTPFASLGAFLQKTVIYGYSIWSFAQIRLVWASV